MIVRTLKIISKLTPTNYNTYRFNKQGYVYLSSRFKKRVLGNYYYDFHKEITEGEDPIVDMSSHYEVGKESKLYRLSKALNFESFINIFSFEIESKILPSKDLLKKRNIKSRIINELNEKQSKLKKLKSTKSPFKIYLNKTLPMIENLSQYWDKADGKTKKKILGCIFKEKIENFDFKSCNYIFTPEIESIMLASKVLKSNKNKKGGQI